MNKIEEKIWLLEIWSDAPESNIHGHVGEDLVRKVKELPVREVIDKGDYRVAAWSWK